MIQCRIFLAFRSWKEVWNPPKTKNMSRKLLPLSLKGWNYESWKAVFMSVVDRLDIPVGEKMFCVQNSLKGKTRTLVKVGYSSSAWERAREKLGKEYAGQRQLPVKQWTSLRGWKNVCPHNLEDLEEFKAVLELVCLATKDCGSSESESLNLAAKKIARGRCSIP